MESCGRYIVLVMIFEGATHFLKCISCSITPQTPTLTAMCMRWQAQKRHIIALLEMYTAS